MLWLIDNSSPGANKDFRIQDWLRDNTVPFKTLGPDLIEPSDKNPIFIVSGGPKFHDQVPDMVKLCQVVVLTNAPILGICLGCFCLAKALGATVERHNPPNMSVRTMPLVHAGNSLYHGVVSPIEVVVSHSESLSKVNWPLPLTIDGIRNSENSEILSFHHEEKPFYGLAFHPEHSDTQGGTRMLLNFINGSSCQP